MGVTIALPCFMTGIIYFLDKVISHTVYLDSEGKQRKKRLSTVLESDLDSINSNDILSHHYLFPENSNCLRVAPETHRVPEEFPQSRSNTIHTILMLLNLRSTIMNSA